MRCWRPARWPRRPRACASTSTARHQGQLVRGLDRAGAERRPARRHQRRRWSGGAGGPGDRGGADAGACHLQGFAIERHHDEDGKKIDLKSATGGVSQLKQNERLVVVLKVTRPTPAGTAGRPPAGGPRDREPAAGRLGDVESLDWLKTDGGAAAHRVPRRPLRRRLRLLRRLGRPAWQARRRARAPPAAPVRQS